MSDPTPLARGQGWRTRLLVGALVMIVWATCFRFPMAWRLTGIGEENRPFLDLYGLLASAERAQAGFDSYQPNPLDPYHRPNMYSEWWLVLGKMGLTRADTAWLGATLAISLLVAALGVLKPVTRREAALAVAVLLSPPLLMAVNRANNDLVVFLVMSAGFLALRGNRGAWRALGIVLFAISAPLKYYPLAGIAVLLHARSRRELVTWVVLYGLVLLLAWPALASGLSGASRFKPRPEWLYTFGAPGLWRNFHWENPALWLVPAGLVLAWSAWSAWRDRGSESTGGETEPADREFLIGSVFVVGCFFLGASYAYKLVFALWLLPWLWRAVLPPDQDRWRKLTMRLLLAVLWLEGLCALGINLAGSAVTAGASLGLLYVVLTCQQLLNWALVACLLRWIFRHSLRRIRILMAPGNSTFAPAA
jgi:hypothetical protein